MSYPDTASLIELLTAVKTPNKEFGQHYLKDDEILAATVELGDVGAGDVILEVGSGPGTLTAHLLNSGAKVVAVEIDAESCEHLKGVFAKDIESGDLTLVEGDALTIQFPAGITHVIANIPFQISSPLIDRLMKHHRSGRGLTSIVLLLQDEFATRLAMLEGSTSRGPLGITTAFEWEIEAERIVHSHAFTPAPAVHSRLVRLTPLIQGYEMPENVALPNLKLARMVVRECFSERRKKMRNRITVIPRRIARVKGWYAKAWRAAAKSVLRQETLAELPTGWFEARPEQLSTTDWLVLVSHIEANKEE